MVLHGQLRGRIVAVSEVAVELLAVTGMEVDKKGVEVEIATEVELQVAGVEKERGRSYNGVLLSYLHVPWLAADAMVFATLLCSFNKIHKYTKVPVSQALSKWITKHTQTAYSENQHTTLHT